MPKSLRVALVLSLLAKTCRVNAQTTRSMATPSDAEIASLKQEAELAHAACDLAELQVIAKVEQTTDYKSANEELKSAQQTLDNNPDATTRMQAATEKMDAKIRIRKMVDRAIVADVADPLLASDIQNTANADAAYQAAVVQKQAADEIAASNAKTMEWKNEQDAAQATKRQRELHDWASRHDPSSPRQFDSFQNHSADDPVVFVTVVGGIIVIGLILLFCLDKPRSPWHLETLPDGSKVWVRENTSWFWFFWF